MSRPAERRLDARTDAQVRRVFARAKQLAQVEYASIDVALGRRPRSTANLLARPGRLSVARGRELAAWADGIFARAGKRHWRDVTRSLLAHLRGHEPYPVPVPLLIIDRDVRAASAAFDAYLRDRGAGSVARGLFGDFLRRRVGTESYARACAWAFSRRVERLAAAQWASITYPDGPTVRPADLSSILYGLEGLLEPERGPVRRGRRAAR